MAGHSDEEGERSRTELEDSDSERIVDQPGDTDSRSTAEAKHDPELTPAHEKHRPRTDHVVFGVSAIIALAIVAWGIASPGSLAVVADTLPQRRRHPVRGLGLRPRRERLRALRHRGGDQQVRPYPPGTGRRAAGVPDGLVDRDDVQRGHGYRTHVLRCLRARGALRRHRPRARCRATPEAVHTAMATTLSTGRCIRGRSTPSSAWPSPTARSARADSQLISAVFAPLIGTRRSEGPLGKAIDIMAIFATLFGSAASLGPRCSAGRRWAQAAVGWAESPEPACWSGSSRCSRSRSSPPPFRYRAGAFSGCRTSTWCSPPCSPCSSSCGADGADPQHGARRPRRLPARSVRRWRDGPVRPVARRWEWLRQLDRLLLGVVDFLGALRRHVHRADLPGSHDPGVRHRCDRRAEHRRPGLVLDLRWRRHPVQRSGVDIAGAGGEEAATFTLLESLPLLRRSPSS